MATDVKNQKVKLKAKDLKNAKPVEFEIAQANKLLAKSNSQWELSDDKFTYNGIEIVIAK